MTKEKVLKLLEENKNEQGIEHWSKTGSKKMISFGMGITQIKELSKRMDKNHELALELWNLPIYEARVLATIIDDAKSVTEAQADSQIRSADFWLLCHSYCSNLLSQVSFIKQKSEEWIGSDDDILRRAGYLLLYQIAKDNKDIDDKYFLKYISIIEKDIKKEENFVKDAMNTALFMIGQRNKTLNKKSIEAAKIIGEIEVDYGDNSCQTLNVLKHLTSDRVQKKINK